MKMDSRRLTCSFPRLGCEKSFTFFDAQMGNWPRNSLLILRLDIVSIIKFDSVQSLFQHHSLSLETNPLSPHHP